MPIIKTHDVTLHGGNEKYNVVLKPLSDEHLPLLYRWSSDPEVLYYSVSRPNMTCDIKTVNEIFNMISQNAFCFLIEANGVPIGECALQKLNVPDVLAMYKPGLNIHKIDMCIGEKTYWGKGIGTVFVEMLIDFAFNHEKVDVLHCICEDINIRTERILLKQGFRLARKDKLKKEPKTGMPVGEWRLHYRLKRDEYMKHKKEGTKNGLLQQ